MELPSILKPKHKQQLLRVTPWEAGEDYVTAKKPMFEQMVSEIGLIGSFIQVDFFSVGLNVRSTEHGKTLSLFVYTREQDQRASFNIFKQNGAMIEEPGDLYDHIDPDSWVGALINSTLSIVRSNFNRFDIEDQFSVFKGLDEPVIYKCDIYGPSFSYLTHGKANPEELQRLRLP